MRVPQVWIVRPRAFGYDALNRLTGAAPAENAPSSFVHTLGCWAYDGMGNRTVNAWVYATDCKSATTATSQYNTNNQVTFVSQASPISYSAPSGFSYDKAGDVLADGQNQYAYDGEGRICAVYDTISGAYTGYIYDAAGLRVAKGGVTSLSCNRASNGFTLKSQYLLDQSGEQVTELDNLGNWVHSNVWAGAHLDATFDPKGEHFHLSDPLGTRRIQTNPTGAVEATFQSLPFGDGFLATLTSLGTANDATENHFTGKERDQESGNDYMFARYYSSATGRFLSPDWSAKEEPVPYAKLGDPQTLNLYSYVQNNPLSRSDNDGHETQTYYGNPSYDAQQANDKRISPTEWKIWGGVALGVAALSGTSEIAGGARALWSMGARTATAAYLGLSVLGTQTAQNLMSARDNVSSSLGAIRDAAASGEISLPGGTANLLRSAGNAVSNSFTNSDINGAIKQSVTGIEAGGDHL